MENSNFKNLLSYQAFLPLSYRERRVLNLFFMFFNLERIVKLYMGDISKIYTDLNKLQVRDILIKLYELKVLLEYSSKKIEKTKDNGEVVHSLLILEKDIGFKPEGVVFDVGFKKMYILNPDYNSWKYSKTIDLNKYIDNFKFKINSEKIENDRKLVRSILQYYCSKHLAKFGKSYSVFPTDTRTIKELIKKFQLSGCLSSEIFNLIDYLFEIKKNSKVIYLAWLNEHVDKYLENKKGGVNNKKPILKRDWMGRIYEVSE